MRATIGSSISASSRMRLVLRSSPTAHQVISTEPSTPMAGSIQLAPHNQPAASATIASTEVAASASTCR